MQGDRQSISSVSHYAIPTRCMTAVPIAEYSVTHKMYAQRRESVYIKRQSSMPIGPWTTQTPRHTYTPARSSVRSIRHRTQGKSVIYVCVSYAQRALTPTSSRRHPSDLNILHALLAVHSAPPDLMPHRDP